MKTYQSMTLKEKRAYHERGIKLCRESLDKMGYNTRPHKRINMQANLAKHYKMLDNVNRILRRYE